jgi:hypothetical protein
MPGPTYQQFQGYPNPVGNYFAGQDAGYARAKEGFNDAQTIQTQNALVQQSGAASYPQLQAQQMQAKQMLEMYGPALQTAVENENYGMRDAIVAALRKNNNPMLGQFADIAATAKKLDKGAYGYDVTFPATEEGKAQRQAFWSKDAFAQSVYPDVNQIQLGMPYRVTTMGMPGTPQAHTNKFEAVSRTSARVKGEPVDRPLDTQEDVDAILEDPEVSDIYKKGLKVAPGNVFRQYAYGSGEEAELRGGKIVPVKGAGVIKGTLDEKIETEEDKQRILSYKLAPDARKVVEAIRPEKGAVVTLKDKGAEGYASAQRRGAGGTTQTRPIRRYAQYLGIPGAFYDTQTLGVVIADRDESGNIKYIPIGAAEAMDKKKEVVRATRLAQQQGGPRAAQFYQIAADFSNGADKLIKDRDNIIKKYGNGVFNGVGSVSTSDVEDVDFNGNKVINKVVQYANSTFRDNPELTKYLKDSKLLADKLQRAIGGAQGGKYALEFAQQLIDPSLPPASFQATLDTHKETLNDSAKNWAFVGEEGRPGSVPKPVIKGTVGEKDNQKKFDAALKAAMAANPKRTRKEILDNPKFRVKLADQGIQIPAETK